MPLNMNCPGCGAKLILDDAFAGRTVRCPRCQHTFPAPGSGAPAPAMSPIGMPPTTAPPLARPTPPGGVPMQLPSTMVANHQVAGRTCPRCSTPIQLGQAVQNCLSCMTSYHQGCWAGSCTEATCPSRATAISPGGHAAQPPVGPFRPTRPCPFCGEVIDAAAMKCRFCNEWLDERMRGGGPQVAAARKMAGEALMAGIIGIFCCQVILGPFAIVKGSRANNMLKELGLPSDGRATAGVVLGWIEFVIGMLGVFSMLSGVFS